MNYKRLSEMLKSTANLIEDFGSALDFDDIETDISKEDLKVFLDMADDIEKKMLIVAQKCGTVVYDHETAIKKRFLY